MREFLINILVWQFIPSLVICQQTTDTVIEDFNSQLSTFEVSCNITAGDICNVLVENGIIHDLHAERRLDSIEGKFIDVLELGLDDSLSKFNSFYVYDFVLQKKELYVLVKFSNLRPPNPGESAKSFLRETDSIFALLSVAYVSLNPALHENDITLIKVSDEIFDLKNEIKRKRNYLTLDDCIEYYKKSVPESNEQESMIATDFSISAKREDCNELGTFNPETTGFFGVTFHNSTFFLDSSYNLDGREVFYLLFDVKKKKVTRIITSDLLVDF